MPIEGRVAEILDRYSLAANIGREDGVEEGMMFEVYEMGPVITDPETGEELGQPETVKISLIAKNVKEQMTIMETPKTTVERDTFSELMEPFKKYETSQQKIDTDEIVKDNRNKVKKGDSIRQVVDDDEESDAEEESE